MVSLFNLWLTGTQQNFLLMFSSNVSLKLIIKQSDLKISLTCHSLRMALLIFIFIFKGICSHPGVVGMLSWSEAVIEHLV